MLKYYRNTNKLVSFAVSVKDVYIIMAESKTGHLFLKEIKQFLKLFDGPIASKITLVKCPCQTEAEDN